MLSVTQSYGNVVANLKESSALAGQSIQRLSSGERITRAADDVASLSVSSTLQTQITSLRQARINTAQAESLLQVMDGGLREIGDILQRMNALATQAGSGTLTAVERGFLDQEFKQLYNEIDRISEQTTFGNLQPLQSLNFSGAVELDSSLGRRYEAILNFDQNWTNNNQFIRLGPNFDNSDRFYWRNNTAQGSPDYNIQNATTLEEKVQNFVNFWNDPDSITQTDERYNKVKVELATPTRVKFTSLSRGNLSSLFYISDDRSSNTIQNSITTHGNAFTRNGGSTQFDYVLRESAEGSETGLSFGSTTVVGSGTGALLNTIQQEQAELRLRFTSDTAGINNNQRIRFDNFFNGLGPNFRFRNNVTNANFHIQIGSTTRETLANFVEFINTIDNDNIQTYNRGLATDYLEFEREGLDLIIRSPYSGTTLDTREDPFRVQETTGGTFIGSDGTANTNDSLTGGSDTGLNVQGVTNADFVGAVQGFEAEFLAGNRVQLGITVGDHRYQATIANTNSLSTERYRLVSDEGGYFDIELAGNTGMDINNQTDADAYARTLDGEFQTLQFYQERVMTNFRGNSNNQLDGARLSIISNDFSEPFVIEDIEIRSISETNTGQAEIRIVTEDDVFVSVSTLDRGIEPTANYRFRSSNDANRFIELTNGSTFFDLSIASQAEAFRTSFLDALPARTTEEEIISFQLGQSTDSSLDVSLVNSTTEELFGEESIGLITKEAASDAFERVQDAIDTVTSLRADVGSAQQRAVYASNAIDSAINSQVSARGALVDTDISFESTQQALAFVQANAAISVLSQANALKQTILQSIFEPLSALNNFATS